MEKYKIEIELDTAEALEILNGGGCWLRNDEIIELEEKVKGDLRQCPHCERWLSEIDYCPYCETKVEERSCVKCGKCSDLIEEEDMCYSCAKERGRK